MHAITVYKCLTKESGSRTKCCITLFTINRAIRKEKDRKEKRKKGEKRRGEKKKEGKRKKM